MGTTSLEASCGVDVSLGKAGRHAVFVYHSRAWERVPAESDAIAVLHLTPLILEGVVVHLLRSPSLIHRVEKGGKAFSALYLLQDKLVGGSKNVKVSVEERSQRRGSCILLPQIPQKQRDLEVRRFGLTYRPPFLKETRWTWKFT